MYVKEGQLISCVLAGVGLYRKQFAIPLSWKQHGIHLVFDAALQYAEVYLNGKHVVDHRGGCEPY